MKRAACFGGSGFIGSHLCARLVGEGYEVTAFDRKMPEFGWFPATHYHKCDLRELDSFWLTFKAGQFDEVYQLAAEMGGAGYVFTGKHDADILASSAKINLNVLDAVGRSGRNPKIFFASSACVYSSISYGACKEDENIDPDSDYGFEKLFAERLYDAHYRNYNFDIRIGRFHNVFGSHGTWRNGREKAPAALCRKIAELPPAGGEIEVWGDGQQTRSFIHVSEAVEAVRRLMQTDYHSPVNIGSSEMVTIRQLAWTIADIAGKGEVRLKPVDGPIGVNGRNSDNTLIEMVTGWKPTKRLIEGLIPTYRWISEEVDKARNSKVVSPTKGEDDDSRLHARVNG